MSLVKRAVYKCDFCGSETPYERDWIFKSLRDTGSSHETRHYFGVCEKCNDDISKKSLVQNFLSKFRPNK